MSIELAQTAIKTIVVDLTFTSAAGATGGITGVQFGACSHDGPDANTVWRNGNYATGSGTLVAAGPLATPPAGSCVFSGAKRELWAYPTGVGGDMDPEYIDTVEVR